MQQHLGRQDGVEKVEVHLADGTAVIYPKEDGRLDPLNLLKAVYDSGVTAVEMTATGSGKLVKNAQGVVQFQMSASLVFDLAPNDLSKGLDAPAANGATLTLRGRLYKKPPGKGRPKIAGPLQFEILEVIKKG